jgi:hypothetical protein
LIPVKVSIALPSSSHRENLLLLPWQQPRFVFEYYSDIGKLKIRSRDTKDVVQGKGEPLVKTQVLSV